MFRLGKGKGCKPPKENTTTRARVLLLGCGPAGLGLLVRAEREGALQQLVERTPALELSMLREGASDHSEVKRPKKDKGVGLVVVDKRGSGSVGGGRLAEYITRSNTSAARFVRSVSGSVAVKNEDVGGEEEDTGGERKEVGGAERKEGGGPSSDAPQDDPLEDSLLASGSALAIERLDSVAFDATVPTKLPVSDELAKVEDDDAAKRLLGFGKYHTPLNRVGEFLNESTMSRVHAIVERGARATDGVARVLCNAEAESVRVQADGTYLVALRRHDLVGDDGGGREGVEKEWKAGEDTAAVPRSFVVADRLVFALGGTQRVPGWIAPPIVRKEALAITSDELLTQQGLDKVVGHLREYLSYPSRRNQEFSPLVCIIGGSHSAFSAAWLLLNGPAVGSNEQPTSPRRPATQPPTATQIMWRKSGKLAMSLGQTLQSPSVFAPGTWGFRRNDVAILHRSRIKVHFSCDGEARRDGYRYLPEEAQGTMRKSVYPFRGLRGDAKKLWMAKKDGSERRLQLKEVSTHTALLSALKSMKPLVVVWAGGYEATTVPFTDAGGNAVALAKDRRGQLVVTGRSQLLRKGDGAVSSFPMPNCFGMGLGAGLPSSHADVGGEREAETRADGFNLYVGAHGRLVLKGLMGKPDSVGDGQEAPGNRTTRVAPAAGDLAAHIEQAQDEPLKNHAARGPVDSQPTRLCTICKYRHFHPHHPRFLSCINNGLEILPLPRRRISAHIKS